MAIRLDKAITYYSICKITLFFCLQAVLELWLWGPPSNIINCNINERQNVIQRWLDLERANVLQSLLMSCSLPPKINPYDHCHLSFLVQTNAKTINDTLSLFNNYHGSNTTLNNPIDN